MKNKPKDSETKKLYIISDFHVPKDARSLYYMNRRIHRLMKRAIDAKQLLILH